jgi:glycosyltransferase involved in cell wall biosynthesis
MSETALPIVSVVVPAFNAEAYLGEALTSLRAQTLTRIEIIVVDDGSTDGTRAVASRHALEDPRVHLLARAEPSGRPACARNQGLAAARGRYIALLDADDVSIPTRLESAVHAMELTGARFAFADMRRLYQDTGEMACEGALEAAAFLDRAAPYLRRVSGKVYLCEPAFPAFLLTYLAINTPTVVFDRALLDAEATWFDESLVCFEDVDLWYRWAEHTRFAFVNEVHTIVRKHASSLTASDPVQTRIDGIAVQSAHLERLRHRLSSAELAAAETHVSELQFDVAYAKWSDGQPKSARFWYLESWRTKPTIGAALGYAKSFLPRSGVTAVSKVIGRRAD